MAEHPLTCRIISDSNLETLAGYLTNDPHAPQVHATVAPFGQVMQTLMDERQWTGHPDLAVIWTRPQAVSEAFSRLLGGEDARLEAALSDVDAFAAAVAAAADRASSMFVPTWTTPAGSSGSALLEMRHESGIANVLMRMNLRLAERLGERSNIFVLNSQPWIEAAGRRAFNPKLWYLAKAPFGHEVLQAAVTDFKAALRGVRGAARKLILLDLDDTLWGGIVGEVGWEQLTLGGHDPSGEAFVDFQQALKTLSRRGVLLGVVSKNDEAVALEAIDKHPEMTLRRTDLAGWKVNWQDKAQNIVDLAAELNLGLQSVVFLDDQPAERARVREALPEVLVPEWPDDPMRYRQALQELKCFEVAAVSQEDRQRTQLYVTERQRTELKRQVGSVEEWLSTLGITVTLEPLSDANLARAAQLLNKTNQMNLTTRRMTEAELAAWAAAAHRRLWTVSVSDKFGSAGLTGLLSLEVDGGVARIVDFVLSCRVMGRKVEETVLAAAVRQARVLGLSEVVAQYLPTAKNAPCLEFWKRSGFHANGADHSFQWDTREDYPFPEQVAVEGAPTASAEAPS